MTDLLLSFLKIAASIGLLGVVLALSARCAPLARAPAEIRRKFIHVSLGAYCLFLPVIFEHAWEVWLACALTIGVFSSFFDAQPTIVFAARGDRESSARPCSAVQLGAARPR